MKKKTKFIPSPSIKKLFLIMKKNNLSRTQVAKVLKVSIPTVQAWHSGRIKNLKQEYLDVLKKKYG